MVMAGEVMESVVVVVIVVFLSRSINNNGVITSEFFRVLFLCHEVSLPPPLLLCTPLRTGL